MRNFLIVCLFLIANGLFAQQAKPGNSKLNPVQGSNIPTPKDSVIYMTPVDVKYDTTEIYAVMAQLKQPLYLEPFRVITKVFVYQDGTQKAGDQYIEKVTPEGVFPVTNFAKRVIYWVKKQDFILE